MGILAAEPAKLENHLVLHIPSCWLLLLEPQKCALLQRQWSLGRLHHTNRVEPLVLEIAREIAACARPHAQKYPDRPVYFRIFSSYSWHCGSATSAAELALIHSIRMKYRRINMFCRACGVLPLLPFRSEAVLFKRRAAA